MTRLDVLIFGATGFTGKFAVRDIMKLAKENGNLKWGIAGRSDKKLRDLLQNLSNQTGEDTRNIPIVTADVNDEKTVQEMASKTRVLINCCGPYSLYAEPIVKACIQNGTHQVDVNGEIECIDNIREKYNKAAEEKGVYIINACGFGSVPAELGVLHLIEQFRGEVNSVEEYLTFNLPLDSESPMSHFTTWEAFVCDKSMSLLSDELNAEKLLQFMPKMKKRPILHKSDIINAWCLPVPGTDYSVIQRSQQFLYKTEKKRPIQLKTYIGFKSLWTTFKVIIMAIIFMIMSKMSFTRKLLLKYPEVFSLGLVSHEDPSEEHLNNITFSMMFYGEGWTEHGFTPEENNKPPNKTIITKVSGRNPQYGVTSIALVLSAITILKESYKMPGNGGILLPGAAFSKTSLRQELMANGVKFEVLSTKVLK